MEELHHLPKEQGGGMMSEKKIRMGHRLWAVDYQKEVLKEIEKSRDSHDGTIRRLKE